MLVLSRKKNESIIINNNVAVTVVEIRGDKVRLGIVHPPEMPVHRQEVYEAIHGGPPPGLSLMSSYSQPIAVAPPPPPVPPAVVPAASPVPASEPKAAKPASMLDRVLDALQLRANVSVSREVMTQAIADAAVQELSAEVVRAASPEQLKAMLLEALKAKG